MVSGLGEDTFWVWFNREFPGCSYEIPKKLNDNDILLRYSTLGFLPIEGKQVSLCWELYPEMKRVFKTNQWDGKINKVIETARYSTYRTVATEYSVCDYSDFGSVDVIPIGVDTDKFIALSGKEELRKKYNIPTEEKLGIWIGTLHPMKGYLELVKYASMNPSIHWIVIWKWKQEAGFFNNAYNFVKLDQSSIVELINAADFALFTSKLVPYYMSEWEMMACDIPIVNINGKREFEINKNPRELVINNGWDRISVKKQWIDFLTKRGVTW